MKLLVPLALLASALVTAVPAADTSSAPSVASRATHRVVFELTSGEPEAWNAVLNNIENVRKSLGETSTQVQLVAHGKGLDFLKSTQTAQKDRMKKLADAGIVFAACENTMKRQKVTKADLMPFATTVDSGVAEIVRKQEAQWSYIRSGN
jgi:uncharacterized protein